MREVEARDQFIEWWSTLSDAQREAVLYDEYLRELGEEGSI
jgi:hypothetical protein